MKLFKKSVPKEFIPPSETPNWGATSLIYATLRR